MLKAKVARRRDSGLPRKGSGSRVRGCEGVAQSFWVQWFRV